MKATLARLTHSSAARPRRSRSSLALALSVASTCIASCGGGTPLLREAPMPKSASATTVTSLPPPARVEVLPIRRNSECRWQDGYYRPRATFSMAGATEWIWTPGAWVVPTEGCRYARPRTEAERSKDGGRIAYFPPLYFDPTTGEACPQPAPCD